MAESDPERIRLEDLPQRREAEAWLREEKGRSPDALEAVNALETTVDELRVDLYWEKCLIGKHMIMEARYKSGLWNLPLKVKGIAEGFLLLRSSARDAQKYIDEHGVEAKRPRTGRFLGEVEMIIGNYGKAAKYFGKSVELFSQMDDPTERQNALELSGFWAESLILGGKIKEGIQIASRTFDSYNVGDGQKLKERSYYVWAVWKSGCAIKVWHAILRKGISLKGEDRERLIRMLNEAEVVVNPPPEIEVRGDFALRKDEIASIKKKLELD